MQAEIRFHHKIERLVEHIPLQAEKTAASIVHLNHRISETLAQSVMPLVWDFLTDG